MTTNGAAVMTTSEQTTTAARRIARRHNQCGPQLAGGVLCFHRDGTGGEWYSSGTRLPAGSINVYLRSGRLTARDAQAILDGCDC